MPDNFDPTTLENPAAAQAFLYLLNQVESLVAQVQTLQRENQALRDEVARLRGEQGKPDIKPNRTTTAPKLSSEQERRTAKARTPKSHKQHYQAISRTQTLQLDRATLPADAVYKGYEEIVVRELRLEPETICFRREKYYSPSLKQTFVAPLPPAFAGGGFGAGVRSLVISLYYAGGMSQPKIAQFLAEAGCPVSVGLLAGWLNDCTGGEFEQERTQMEQAGLASSEWQGIDDTSTRVDGVNRVCEIICNPLYTTYHTVERKDRHTVLALLCGSELQYRYNEEARALLVVWQLPQGYIRRLEQAWPTATTLNRNETAAWLKAHLPQLGEQQVNLVWNALGLAYYHWQQRWPVVSLLVCDDAPQWEWLSAEMGLCWIHEGRHYKKLTPTTPYFAQLLTGFRDQFWRYYRELLAYGKGPSTSEGVRLRLEFERIFGQVTGYALLDKQIAKTKAKQAQLLMVLLHPEIPLHNNASELAARQRVRKRDISFGPRSAAGVLAWDVFQSLAETCRKLGISFYSYVHSRLSASAQVGRLADIIKARANQLNLSGSWATM